MIKYGKLLFPILLILLLSGCKDLPPVFASESVEAGDDFDLFGYILEPYIEISNPFRGGPGEYYIFSADVYGSKKPELVISTAFGSIVFDNSFKKAATVDMTADIYPAPFLLDLDQDRKYDIPATGMEGGTNYIFCYSLLGATVKRYDLLQADQNYDRIIAQTALNGKIYCTAPPGTFQDPRGILCFDAETLDLLWEYAIPAIPDGVLLSENGERGLRLFVSHTTNNQGMQNFIGREKMHLPGGDAVVRYYLSDEFGRTIRYNPLFVSNDRSRTIPEAVNGSLVFAGSTGSVREIGPAAVHIPRTENGEPEGFQLLMLGPETGFISNSSKKYADRFRDIETVLIDGRESLFVLSSDGDDSILRELSTDLISVAETRLTGTSLTRIDGVIKAGAGKVYLLCSGDSGCVLLDPSLEPSAEIPAPGLVKAGLVSGSGGELFLVLAGSAIRIFRFLSP